MGTVIIPSGHDATSAPETLTWTGCLLTGPFVPQPRDNPNTYQYIVSEPLGRSSYKERYLFVFR